MTQENILKAATILNDIVGATMGPNGHNIAIRGTDGSSHRVTKDGATVASKVFNEDGEINGYIKNISEVSLSVEAEVGDGTSTATVMATSALMELISGNKDKLNPRYLINRMDKLLDQCMLITDKLTYKPDDNTAALIAAVSTNHDEVMTSTILKVVDGIGPYGRMKIATGGDIDTVNTVKGYTIDTGIISDTLINEPSGVLTLDTDIIYYDNELRISDMESVLESKVKESSTSNTKLLNIVLVANSFAEDDTYEIVSLCRTLCGNGINVYPVSLSSIPNRRKDQMADIKAMCSQFATVTLMTGKTTFHSSCTEESLEEYINTVESYKEHITSGFNLEHHKERLQRLRGGYATVMVAGTTPAERKERQDRILDAVLAVQSALREGVTVGGGLHYIQILGQLDLDKEKEVVFDTMTTMLTEVFNKVHLNSGCALDVTQEMVASAKVGVLVDSLDYTDEISSYISYFDTESERTKFEAYDSAGTPKRVFEAVRSVLHTLLPVYDYIDRRGVMF